MTARDIEVAAGTTPVSLIRFYVEAGKVWQSSWVVIDRRRGGVVAEFDRRKDAQEYVKERNHA